jgi:hypothetical protein
MKKGKDGKPTKIMYNTKVQKELRKKFKKFILKKYSKSKCVNQIIACGGLIKGTFGIYSEFHHDRYGSDADLVIVINPKYKIPKSWGKIQIWKAEFFDLYVLDTIDHLVPATKYFDFKPIHLIHAKVFTPGKHDPKKMKNWGAIKSGDYETWYLKDKAGMIPVF